MTLGLVANLCGSLGLGLFQGRHQCGEQSRGRGLQTFCLHDLQYSSENRTYLVRLWLGGVAMLGIYLACNTLHGCVPHHGAGHTRDRCVYNGCFGREVPPLCSFA